MRKIKLHLESLAVESFDTTLPDRAAGTVAAHQLTDYPCEYESGSCGLNSCEGTCVRTCWFTCPDTCAATCGGTCPGGQSCAVTCGCQPLNPRTVNSWMWLCP